MIVEDERDNYELAFDYDVVEDTTQRRLLTMTAIHAIRCTFKDLKKFATPKHTQLSKRT